MNKKPKLKYYMYVSEAKLDMLHSQIPKALRSKLEAQVKLNLKLVDVAFSEKQFDDSIYSKLNTTIEYLKQNADVGSIQTPKEYFYGSMYLQWAQIYPGIVFWGGKLNNTVIGLGGSMRFVLGQKVGAGDDVDPYSHSHSAYLVDMLMQELQVQIIEPKVSNKLPKDQVEFRIMNAVEYWNEEFSKRRTIQKFEFFAKKLRHSNNILLGTPLYMALE